MKIAAEFVISAAGARDFPEDGASEIALVGRSNVGKSTLINALVGGRLARTSAAPGKTRLINFYRVRAGSSTFYLADLPGYGYTSGGLAARQAFDELTLAYFSRLKERRGAARGAGAHASGALRGGRDPTIDSMTLLLVDARHPGLVSDLSARRWLEERSLPTTVVATKIDKLTRAERPRVCRDLQAALYAPVVPVSAVTGEGLKELWKQILAPINRT